MFRASTRFLICRGTNAALLHTVPSCPPPSNDLSARLAAHVPATFSTLTNISSVLPADLLRAAEEQGGLHAVLSSSPRRFVLSQIGKVVVVRLREGVDVDHKTSVVPETSARCSGTQQQGERAALSPPPVPAEVLPQWAATDRFPRFAVPLDNVVQSRGALCLTKSSVSPSDPGEETPMDRRLTQKTLRDRVLKEVEAYKTELELFEVSGDVIVRPKCDAVFRAGIYEARDAWEAQEVSGGDFTTSPSSSSTIAPAVLPHSIGKKSTSSATAGEHRGGQPSALGAFEDMEAETREFVEEGRTVGVQLTELEKWLIKHCNALVLPHEWNRTARAMHCRPQRLFADEHLALQQTLDPRRCLAHVLASAQSLFHVEHDRPNRPPLVHYVLQPAYRDYRRARCSSDNGDGDTEEEIAAITRKLALLKKQKFPLRDKVRHLSRRLQYLRRPLPMLDHTVFAQAVFDQLPVDGSTVPYSDVLRTFSNEELMCRPRDTRRFLQEFRHLFVACQQGLNSAELHLMRSDSLLSASVAEREKSVSDEEVVVTMFELIPRAMDPGEGYLLDAVRKRLPLRVLRAIEDRGLLSILRNQKDKVELLSTCREVTPPSTCGASFHSSPSRRGFGSADGNTVPNHQIRFRFIGMFHESLLAIYRETKASQGK